MADEEEDQTTGLDPEFVAQSAAEVLAEQQRLEEEALRLALPKQSAEAELLGAGAATVPVAPGEYQFGSVMPTSKGFMYVGKGVPTPEAGSPLAATREFESAVLRQNPVAAREASAGLVSMGLQRPGEFVGLPQEAPMPMNTLAEEQFAVMDRWQRAKSKGYSDAEAAAMSGWSILPVRGRYGQNQMTPYQQASLVARQRELDLRESAQTTAAARPSAASISSLSRDKQRLSTEIFKLQQSRLFSPESQRGEIDKQIASKAAEARSVQEQLDTLLPHAARPAAAPAPAPTSTAPRPAPAQKKSLDRATAKVFLDRAKGDKAKARQLARNAGYDV